MAQEIGMMDLKLKYASIEEAKTMSGLRLILGAYTIPGPWREACKSRLVAMGENAVKGGFA